MTAIRFVCIAESDKLYHATLSPNFLSLLCLRCYFYGIIVFGEKLLGEKPI